MLQSDSRRPLVDTVSAGALNPDLGYQTGRGSPEAQKCSKAHQETTFRYSFGRNKVQGQIVYRPNFAPKKGV